MSGWADHAVTASLGRSRRTRCTFRRPRALVWSTPVDHPVDERAPRCAEEQWDETSGLWTLCPASLREQVSDATWQMWLSGIEPVSFSDGEMVLGGPNAVVRDRGEGRFIPLIGDILSAVAGTPVKVRLEVLDRPVSTPHRADEDAAPGDQAQEAANGARPASPEQRPAPAVGPRETPAVARDAPRTS